METTLLVADYARVADGKLDLVGAGWSITGPMPANFGIGILFHVGWDEANSKHHFVVDLLDADGGLVLDPAGEQPVFHFEGDFEAGRPAGLKPGTPQVGPFAANVAGCPIPPGGRYQLRLVVDGDEDAASSLAFTTRPPGPQLMAA